MRPPQRGQGQGSMGGRVGGDIRLLLRVGGSDDSPARAPWPASSGGDRHPARRYRLAGRLEPPGWIWISRPSRIVSLRDSVLPSSVDKRIAHCATATMGQDIAM